MINDMGIQVYEQAPDAEALLMNDVPTPIADDDAVEEAEQALATVDSSLDAPQTLYVCICVRWAL